jgi:hypothetical protein
LTGPLSGPVLRVLRVPVHDPLIIVSACRPSHLFEARLADGVLCVSRQPLLDAARILLAERCDPDTAITMRHAGRDTIALSAKLGVAAKLTVDESGPHLGRRWTRCR